MKKKNKYKKRGKKIIVKHGAGKINSNQKNKIHHREKIGINKFDKLIQGGIEPGSINLIVGGGGSGKTIFAMQFLIEGIKKGENVLYITFEEEKKEFYDNMLKVSGDLNKMEKTGKFTFLEYSPEKIKMMLDEGGGSVESIIIKKNIKRMVIDSINSFSMLFKESDVKRQNISSLFDIIRKWNCTTFLTYQKDNLKEGGGSIAEVQADGLILLNFEKIKGKRQRTIEVLKMRGTKHSTDTYSFEIGKGGIKIRGKIKK